MRCSASGKKVFFYRYRSKDGALREIRLGDVGPLTLAKARDAALRKRVERDQGKDPQLEKRKEREEATRERVVQRYTVNDLVDDYVKEALSKQKRGAEAERLLRKYFLPVFDGKPATELTRRELQDELIGQRCSSTRAPPLRFSRASVAPTRMRSIRAGFRTSRPAWQGSDVRAWFRIGY